MTATCRFPWVPWYLKIEEAPHGVTVTKTWTETDANTGMCVCDQPRPSCSRRRFLLEKEDKAKVFI